MLMLFAIVRLKPFLRRNMSTLRPHQMPTLRLYQMLGLRLSIITLELASLLGPPPPPLQFRSRLLFSSPPLRLHRLRLLLHLAQPLPPSFLPLRRSR